MKVSKNSKRKHNRSWVSHIHRAADVIGTGYQAYKHFSNTKTNNKVERLKGDDIHSGVTDASYTVVIAKAKKTADFKSAKSRYQEVTGGRYQTQPGQQTANTLTTIGTVSEWMINTGEGVDHFGTANIRGSLFSQNVSQYSTGSAAYGQLQGVLIASDKFYLSRCNLKLSICNFANLPVSVWVYVCVSKRDHNQPPHIDWSEQEFIAGVNQGQADTTPAGTQIGGTYGANYKELPGNTPGKNSMWRNIWGIKKVHRVNLAGAAQEDVDFHVVMNQLGDISRFISLNPAMDRAPVSWQQPNITCQYPRGSVAVMVVHRGGVVHDTTSEAGAVTYGKCNVGYVVSKQYTMYPVKAKSNRFETSLAYPQIPYGVTNANSKMMNVVDAVQTFTEA